MTNSFYNTQEINNKFKIIVDDVIIYDYEIPVGNYNVIQFLEWLNANVKTLITVPRNFI